MQMDDYINELKYSPHPLPQDNMVSLLNLDLALFSVFCMTLSILPTPYLKITRCHCHIWIQPCSLYLAGAVLPSGGCSQVLRTLPPPFF